MNYKKIKLTYILGVIIVVLVLFSGCTSSVDDNIDPEIQISKDVTVIEADVLITNNSGNQNFVILDIRTLEEYNSEHIEDSVMIDYYSSTFSDDLNKLDKNATYLIYCRTGRRTGLALDIMKGLGFIEVYNMLGGITQWKAEGFPVVQE